MNSKKFDLEKCIRKILGNWELVALVAAVLIALIAIVTAASQAKEIRRLRTTYNGLPEEGGFPVASYSDEAYYYDDYYFLNYDDGATTALRGIDVSAHQGEIDWEQAKEAGVEFAMIRAGYRSYADGSLKEDDWFKANLKGAKKQKIKTGVYFFSQAITVEEAIEEAQFVVDLLDGHKLDMPIAFDMEPIPEDGRIKDLTMMEKTEIADAFCQIVENYGYDSLIYGNRYWIFESLNLSLLGHRNLWLAHYNTSTDFPYDYAMWQYTDSGIVAGVEGGCDLNIFYVKND